MGIPAGFVKFRADAVGFEMRDRIKKVLTIVPESTSSYKTDVEIIRLWAEEGDWFGVPRGIFNQRIRGRIVDEFEFNFSDGDNKLFPSDPISLRDGQEEIISEAVQSLGRFSFGGVIIEATMGAGKTAISLEIARRLGRKTLVIVHTSVLADQWVPEIKKFFPTWRIGRLQADKIDIDNKDIVIGTTQSCSMKDYPSHVYAAFGTIIADETHVLAAPEYGKVLQRFAPRYIIGVTGTINRADKAEDVFIHGMGPVIRAMNKVKVLEPHVYLIDTKFSWWNMNGDDGKDIDKQKPYFLRSAVESNERNEIILRQTAKAAAAGRNILVLGERVAHIEFLAAQMKRRGLNSVGVMVGSTGKRDREMAQEAQIICATNKLVGTGFNVSRLDTLIFATPVQAVEQPCGRVLRVLEGKKQPIVLDLVDSNCHMAMILARSRYRRYVAKNWKVIGKESLKLGERR